MLKSGIIIVNKPQDFTSHDVIAKMRGILRTKKLGHGGTLDPMATGVLPVFVGSATKASDYAAAQQKSYVAKFKIGMETDTQDSTGTVVSTGHTDVKKTDITAVLEQFKGEIEQIPPMYSAIQIDGQRLYDLARQGIKKDIPSRKITVFNIELLSSDEINHEYEISLTVSKGTYVRTICHDIGIKLGTFATMTDLVRTTSGDFTLENSYTLEDLQKLSDAKDIDKINEIIIDTDNVFMEYPAIKVTKKGALRAFHGAFIALKETDGNNFIENQIFRVYYENHFIMLGQIRTLDKGGLAMFTYKNFDISKIGEVDLQNE